MAQRNDPSGEFNLDVSKIPLNGMTKIEVSRNDELGQLFQLSGSGVHLAGMLRLDRSLPERLFPEGIIKPVLVYAAKLAWGVNLGKAHCMLVPVMKVAQILRVNAETWLFSFDASYRPVGLSQQYIAITEQNVGLGSQLMNEVRYGKIEVSKLSRNGELVQLFLSGSGVRHAGMLRLDRTLPERLFPAEGIIKVFGQALRPQFGISSKGMIITYQDELSHYLGLLVHQLRNHANQSYVPSLRDTSNAKVVSGTVRLRIGPHGSMESESLGVGNTCKRHTVETLDNGSFLHTFFFLFQDDGEDVVKSIVYCISHSWKCMRIATMVPLEHTYDLGFVGIWRGNTYWFTNLSSPNSSSSDGDDDSDDEFVDEFLPISVWVGSPSTSWVLVDTMPFAPNAWLLDDLNFRELLVSFWGPLVLIYRVQKQRLSERGVVYNFQTREWEQIWFEEWDGVRI